MFAVHANLDAEATWAGIALPAAIRARLGAIAALLAALAPPDIATSDVEVWAPTPVDPTRLIAIDGWQPASMRVGAPPRADLRWAEPSARAHNDRRATLALAQTLGHALPGARIVASLPELDAHLAADGAAASATGAWVCKAPLTAAGRDRAHGNGTAPPTGELRARLARLFTRHRELVFEPWLDRIADFGICAHIAGADATDATVTVTVAPPHRLLCDARGAFTGIDTVADSLAEAESSALTATAHAVGATLAARGYRGPFGLDAFAYRSATATDGARQFHPLCELNARFTFGAVARALAHRLGRDRARVLGFGPPPAGATTLITPTPSDPARAWIFSSA